LENYTNRNILDESTLRKSYLCLCYDKAIIVIRESIGNSDIWISVDKTTDTNSD